MTSRDTTLDGGPEVESPPGPAPAAMPPAMLRPRGSDQGGLRQYNERAVLQAIRLHGPTPAADLARLTGLTAQTVSQISKRLLDDGLLRKGAPLRGRVGQPSVPLALDPDGATAIGIKVGRRSLEVLWVDFTGAPRERFQLEYAVPDPDVLLAEIAQRLRDLKRQAGPAFARVQGVGIAAPLSMDGWGDLLGMPPALAERWRATDLRAAVQALVDRPVALMKDTAAACVAELVAGRGRSVGSFLYLFVDTFIGGGLVLDSQLRTGLSGNAGAVGSLPMGRAGTAAGAPPAQLLAVASLLTLERRFAAAGLDTAAVVDGRALAEPFASHTRAWLDDAADAIALAVLDAACLLDLEAVIVDGSFDRALLEALLAAVARALDGYGWEGVQRPALHPGTVGPQARALGGALLPLHAQFAPDPGLFLKAIGRT